MAIAQYRQIDILIILGTIGFDCISAHAEGFLKAVGRKPSGEGSRFTGQFALLRFYHLPITRKCNYIDVPI
jgi:hypothetical protein